MADGEKTVAVLGGGIAGLSAAHQLCKRGYRVTVFEARGRSAEDLGGKARSYPYTDKKGRLLYGEHGFRFFPGFYSHVIETMSEIPVTGAGTVEERLVPQEETAFYARPSEHLTTEEVAALSARFPGSYPDAGRRKTLVDRVLLAGTFLLLGWLIWASVLWYRQPGWEWWALWILSPIGWLLVRTCLESITAPARADLCLTLPTRERGGKSRAQGMMLRFHRWACTTKKGQPNGECRTRYLAATMVALGAAAALVATGGLWWRVLPLVIVPAAIIWWYPTLATMNYLWRQVNRIPIKVRPGVLESIYAFLRVAAVVASSRRRTYEQWERESWWSYIGAPRHSSSFRLAYATGLTRSFVATRAEEMSARTAATILVQLLFDASPTLLSRVNPADRVLNAPTHEAWLTHWVTYLRDQGVRFNEFEAEGAIVSHDRVEVTRLLLNGDDTRIDGFEYRSDGASPECTRQSFDYYVMAVSGTAAQRILANSSEVIRADRRRDRETRKRPADPLGDHEWSDQVPYLDGIFNLKFGWMTGIVYHLTEPAELPRGHVLCLESEWALTAIEQRHIWDRDLPTWKALVSVNVSDWDTPTSDALPARFGGLQAVADEAWRQLRTDIPSLAHIGRTPEYVVDPAINDPSREQAIEDAVEEAIELSRTDPGLPVNAILENMPLINDERLLINTAGSWDNRPTTRTVFANFVVAGDYARTCTDFASMESADEAARRATNVIVEDDETPNPPCDVRELPMPREFTGLQRLVRGADSIAMRFEMPHPLMVLATPIGWVAALERLLRTRLLAFSARLRRNRPGTPSVGTDTPAGH